MTTDKSFLRFSKKLFKTLKKKFNFLEIFFCKIRWYFDNFHTIHEKVQEIDTENTQTSFEIITLLFFPIPLSS